MKPRPIAATLLVVSVLTVGGCTFLPGIVPSQAPTLTPEEAFIEAVTAEVVGISEQDHRDLIGVGTAICQAIDRGVRRQELIDTAGQPQVSYSARELGVIWDEAERHLCE